MEGGVVRLALTALAAASVGYALAVLRQSRRRRRRAVPRAPPHPAWRPDGRKQGMPFEDTSFTSMDPKELKSCYPLIISSYVPRPIAFVSTWSTKYGGNLAPFSYSGAFNHDPPIIGFSVTATATRPDGRKDTLANLDENPEFVISLMSEWFAEAANHCCGSFERCVDEFDASHLTRIQSDEVAPPRVGESAVHYECRVVHRHEMKNDSGRVTATLVLGRVVRFHVARAVLDPTGAGEGKPTVLFDALRPLSRLGGNTYGTIDSTFDLPRPDRRVTAT